MKPVYYYKAHVERLRGEIKDRYERLMAALDGSNVVVRGKDCLDLNGSKVRLATDDFRTILSEVRRLK